MKNNIFICSLFLAFILASCDRNFEFETISITEPALEVLVEGVSINNTHPKIADATVKLYNNDGELLATKTTDASGKVIFSKQDLRKEGIFKVEATKNTLSGNGKTSYMLLNDGITLLIITIS